MKWSTPRGVEADMLGIEVAESEFELRSGYNVHFPANTFEKGMIGLVWLGFMAYQPL